MIGALNHCCLAPLPGCSEAQQKFHPALPHRRRSGITATVMRSQRAARWVAFWILALITASWCARAAEPQAEAPLHLDGVVTSENGQVLTNASVFIYTAGPRVGVGFL